MCVYIPEHGDKKIEKHDIGNKQVNPHHDGYYNLSSFTWTPRVCVVRPQKRIVRAVRQPCLQIKNM